MKNNTKQKKKEKMSRKKILLTIICIFTILLVVFGATLAIIVGIRNANAVVYIDDVRLDEGECNFFAAYYKYMFISAYKGEGAADTAEFWNSVSQNGKTYGERLNAGALRYINDIAIKNYLFNSYCEFTKEDDVKVKKAVKEVLLYKAENSVDKFNELASPSGFDFEDFEACAPILYKASALQERVFGLEGEKLKSFVSGASSSDDIAIYLDEQLDKYSHVKLLFIRTEDTFKLDENGNRVRNEDGEDTLVPLSEEGKEQRRKLIADIRTSIAAFNSGSGEGEMTPTYFNWLLSEHGSEGDVNMNDDGYYFLSDSEFTREFCSGGEDLKSIADMSVAMSTDSYAEVPFDGGICFIYKSQCAEKAYLGTDTGGCFSDFYAIAVGPVISSVTESYMPDVTVKDRLLETDFTELSSSNLFIPSFN